MTGPTPAEAADFYDARYRRSGTVLVASTRRETYGEDLCQTGWMSAPEQSEIADLLKLGPGRHLLDVGCGSGGASLVRARHAAGLARVEGAAWFEQRQGFLATTPELAASRRMSRSLYLAARSADRVR